MIQDYTSYDALGLAQLVRAGEVSPGELVEAAIARIEALNPALNAVVHKAFDHARAWATRPLAADAPLAGVPYLMKSLATLWEGIPQTNSCPYFKDFVAPVDLEIVARLKRAGIQLVGVSNAPEFGWALTTEPAMYGPARNPWSPNVTPGGSSGGSAAAVAARIVPIAEASDAAGSIRGPASNCGLVGLKPTRGRATLGPVYGDFFYGAAHFLCVSRTVRDTAAYLDVTSGAAPGDPYLTPPPPRPFLKEVGADPGRLRIAMTTTPPDGAPIHAEAVAAVAGAAKRLEGLGHAIAPHDLAVDAGAAWRTYTRITAVQTAMVFENMAPLIGHDVREDEVSPTMWAIIQRGRSISGVEHSRDVETLRVTARAIAGELAPYDALLTPTLTHPPRPFGYWDMSEPDIDAYNARWTDAVFMYLFNISGQPAVSLPLHWTKDGLPMGVQLVGRLGEEATLLRLAAQLEAEEPWSARRPPLCAE